MYGNDSEGPPLGEGGWAIDQGSCASNRFVTEHGYARTCAILRDENVEPQYRMSTPRGSRRLLDPEVHLKGMYEVDLARPGRERCSMQGLYEALVCEGYTGSYDTVRRYIVRLKCKAHDLIDTPCCAP